MIDIKKLQPLFDDFAGILQNTASRLSGISITIGNPVVNLAASALVFEHLTEPCAVIAALFSEPHPGGVILTAIPMPLGAVVPDRIVSPGSQAVPGKLSDLHRGALREMFQQVWHEASIAFEKKGARHMSPGGVEVEHSSPADFIKKVPALTMTGDFVAAVYPVIADKFGEFEMVQLAPVSFMQHIIEEEKKELEPDPAPSVDISRNPKKKISTLEIPKIQPGAVKKQSADIVAGKSSSRLPAGESIKRNLETLMDIPVQIKIEMGHGIMTSEKILSIGPGSVVELHTDAHKPVGIYANGRLVARGNVVALGEKFGVQVVEIVSPKGRMSED